MLRSGVLGILLATIGAAEAADTAGSFAVDGVGSRPCADFVAAQTEKSDMLIAFAGWTGGFLTGVNVFRSETFDITPFQPTELVMAKMAQYCAANPDEVYVNALGKLIATLMPGRVAMSTPLVRFANGDQAVFVYGSVLEDIRTRLAADGFAPPALPGAFDAAFAEALIRYQTAKGLPPSGLPDLATLNSLYP